MDSKTHATRPKRYKMHPIAVQVKPREAVSARAQQLLSILEGLGPSGEIRLRELADQLGLKSSSRVSGIFRELREAGLVHVERRGMNLPNRYTLPRHDVAA